MKYTTLLITLFLVGCPTAQEVADQQEIRADYRQCLKDQVELINNMADIESPRALECQKPVVPADAKLGAASKECLLVLEHYGPGTFAERQQAFRTCWDRVDNAHIDALSDCRYELADCREELRSYKDAKSK